MAGHIEITLTPEDFAFEPGLGEDFVPTGPLQGDVPTLPAVSTVLWVEEEKQPS